MPSDELNAPLGRDKGKQATAKLTTGETVTGTISQVKMQDGKPIAVIDGKDVDTSLITQIGS